jgi:hypothetical protein
MKATKPQIKAPKILTPAKSTNRKSSAGCTLNKEGKVLYNYSLRAGLKKQPGKEGSPKTSIQKQIASLAETAHLKTALKGTLTEEKRYGSQDKPSYNKNRSLTPGNTKEMLEKFRVQSFHFSPQDGTKAAPSSTEDRSNSPKECNTKKYFDHPFRGTLKMNHANSPKTKIHNALTGHLSKTMTVPVTCSSEVQMTRRTNAPETPGSPQALQRLGNSQPLLEGDASSPGFLTTKHGLTYTTKCVNHELRKSKFYLVQNDRLLKDYSPQKYLRGLCSKCAVKMANYGFQVEEIDEGDEEEKRKRIKDFLNKVNVVIELSKITEETLECRESILKEHYKAELGAIEGMMVDLQRMVATVHKALTVARSTLIEDATSEISKVNASTESLRLRLKELALLARHLTERHNDTLESVDLTGLEKSFSQFGEALTSTVEDCKKVYDSKFQVFKLNIHCMSNIFQFETKLLEGLKIKKQEIGLKDSRGESFSKVLEKLTDLERHIRGRLTARSSFESSSWNDLPQNDKQVYISFDNKNVHDSGLIAVPEIDLTQSDKESMTDNYISILDKIDENQTQNKLFYNTVAQVDHDPLFIVNSHDANFSEKQTPELGIKDQTPEYLKQQFAQLHQQYELLSLQKKSEIANVHSEKSPKTELGEKFEKSAGLDKNVTSTRSQERTNFTEASRTSTGSEKEIKKFDYQLQSPIHNISPLCLGDSGQ